MPASSSPTIIDILFQFIEQSSLLLNQLRPILFHIKNNSQIMSMVHLLQAQMAQLPESVSLLLTVFVIFLSSVMILRVGKSLLSVLVTVIQVLIVALVSFVVWKLREPLGAWLEQLISNN
jgi:hypothetical protein